MPSSLKNIFLVIFSLFIFTKNNAQSQPSFLYVDTLLISSTGMKEHLALFKSIQLVLLPIFHKYGNQQYWEFSSNNQLVYKCRTSTKKPTFELDIALLTPQQHLMISGVSIYTRIWQPIKNHHLIVSIKSKGRRQKKLEKELIRIIRELPKTLS